MDKEIRLALAQQGESFIASDLYKHIKASMTATAINLFVASKASDSDTHRDARYLLGTIDLFDRDLVKLVSELKMERAERVKAEKRTKKM